MPDWKLIQQVTANDTPRVVYVGGFSYTLIMSALSEIEQRWKWRDETDGEISDSDWDAIQDGIARANIEMIQGGQLGQVFWSIATLPSWVLPLDGSTYNKADYPSLYDVIPAGWKTATQFTLPDWRDRFPVMAGNAYSMGDTGGENQHTLTEAEIPSHAHIYTPPIINIDLESPGAPDIAAAGIGPQTYTGSTGGGQSHENRPPYVALNVGIIAW